MGGWFRNTERGLVASQHVLHYLVMEVLVPYVEVGVYRRRVGVEKSRESSNFGMLRTLWAAFCQVLIHYRCRQAFDRVPSRTTLPDSARVRAAVAPQPVTAITAPDPTPALFLFAVWHVCGTVKLAVIIAHHRHLINAMTSKVHLLIHPLDDLDIPPNGRHDIWAGTPEAFAIASTLRLRGPTLRGQWSTLPWTGALGSYPGNPGLQKPTGPSTTVLVPIRYLTTTRSTSTTSCYRGVPLP